MSGTKWTAGNFRQHGLSEQEEQGLHGEEKEKCQLVNRSPLCQVRNNPLGLAEPSVKRDGYAVGSREGSMYRRYLQDTHSAFRLRNPQVSSKLTFTFSTGNLNVSSGVAGSRAGSESKDLPKGNWKERRASTSDLKVLFTLLRVHQL